MNGQYREHMSAGYQGQIASIAKKAAFPFAGYMTE